MANRARMPVRVAIVQHDALLRDLLRIGLAQSPGIDVTGTYADGGEFLRETGAARPQVAVLDIDPHGHNGVPLALKLRRVSPDLGIVFLVGDRETGLLTSLPSHGLHQWSYLVNTPHQGVTALSRAIQVTHARLLNLGDIEPLRRVDPGPAAAPQLVFTKHQLEILDLLARGFTNKVIAQTLHVKVKTVENRLAAVYERIDPGSDRASVHPRVRAALLFRRYVGGDVGLAERGEPRWLAAYDPESVDEGGEQVEERHDGEQHER